MSSIWTSSSRLSSSRTRDGDAGDRVRPPHRSIGEPDEHRLACRERERPTAQVERQKPCPGRGVHDAPGRDDERHP